MGIFNFLFRKKNVLSHGNTLSGVGNNQPFDKIEKDGPKEMNFMDKRVQYFYEHPETLVDIEFSNRTNTLTNIWVEPTCMSIDIDKDTEYKIVTHDRFFRMEFDKNNRVVFYLQYSFGFKLYKRGASVEVVNKNEWILDYDCSNIN